MKKKIIICVCILLVLLCGIFFITKNKGSNKDAIKFKEDYEAFNNKTNSSGKNYRSVNIDKNNPFIYKTEDDIVNMINNKETFIVYFGFNTCPWCRSVIEELISVSKDLKVNTIYYVNIRPNDEDIRDTITIKEDGSYEKTKEGTSGYNKLLELMDNVLADYSRTDKDGNSVDVHEKRIYAPNVVAVLKGKTIKLDTGISSNQTDAYMTLTADMKKETYDKFKEVLKSIQIECNEAC